MSSLVLRRRQRELLLEACRLGTPIDIHTLEARWTARLVHVDRHGVEIRPLDPDRSEHARRHAVGRTVAGRLRLGPDTSAFRAVVRDARADGVLRLDPPLVFEIPRPRARRRFVLAPGLTLPVHITRAAGPHLKFRADLLRIAPCGVVATTRGLHAAEARIGDCFLARTEPDPCPALMLRLSHRRLAPDRNRAVMGFVWNPADEPSLWRRPLAHLLRVARRRRALRLNQLARHRRASNANPCPADATASGG